MAVHHTYERIAVFVFGVIFITVILVLAIRSPDPSDFQYTIFRIVLALAAAGVAAFVPGFLQIEVNKFIRAGGAMAVFVIVYFYSPAQLVHQPKIPKKGQEVGFVTESMISPALVAHSDPHTPDLTPVPIGSTRQDNTPLEYNIYFTIWNRHPYERIRISSFDIEQISYSELREYCCPETRSVFSMKLVPKNGNNADTSIPLQTTFEIPPLSSNSFEDKLEVSSGEPDRASVTWFGLVLNYSGSDGVLRKAKSDKVFLVGMGKEDGAYDALQLQQFQRRQPEDAKLTEADRVSAWLAGKASGIACRPGRCNFIQ